MVDDKKCVLLTYNNKFNNEWSSSRLRFSILDIHIILLSWANLFGWKISRLILSPAVLLVLYLITGLEKKLSQFEIEIENKIFQRSKRFLKEHYLLISFPLFSITSIMKVVLKRYLFSRFPPSIDYNHWQWHWQWV